MVSIIQISEQYNAIGLMQLSNSFKLGRINRRSLANVLLSENIAFLALFVKLFTAWEKVPEGLNKSPKYLYSGAIVTKLLPIKNFSLCISIPDLLKIITFVFLIFTCRFQYLQYLSSLFKEDWRPSGDSDISTRSSAYSRHDIFFSPSNAGLHLSSNSFTKSLRYSEKRVGLSEQPCLTPAEVENAGVIPHVPTLLKT